ncbi:uncharacterized protein BDW47DRAFT_14837 [Aspergillus candidus]|uniref:Uncharacterized protein n=1 Tax=Aspergillus candidus TaxID=41067 RepID=A0A2I2FFB4_ASPCN|nr:hypothetical protein BDW47DRAFT_14837 [Aspergillus candidus]PLB39311.1 hypothetical protein BDW47DRAFT_14837 [Aspergillus candidus]
MGEEEKKKKRETQSGDGENEKKGRVQSAQKKFYPPLVAMQTAAGSCMRIMQGPDAIYIHFSSQSILFCSCLCCRWK